MFGFKIRNFIRMRVSCGNYISKKEIDSYIYSTQSYKILYRGFKILYKRELQNVIQMTLPRFFYVWSLWDNIV